MRNETVRAALDQLAGRHVCDDCADTFLEILDRIRSQRATQTRPLVLPSPRQETVPISPDVLAALRANLGQVRPVG